MSKFIFISKAIKEVGIRRALQEYRNRRSMAWNDALWKWVQNRNHSYTWIPEKQWTRFKTSNTIFLFGSGPSINEITPEQWNVIQSHDSMGLNFSFLTCRPMTFYYLGYEPGSTDNTLLVFDEKIREVYKNSLWFVPNKVLFRLYHPRLLPGLFPPNPQLARFSIPLSIELETDRPFRKEDFVKTLTYRGVMGVGLHLADLLGYQKIVLMGVDLHTYKHFFDDFETTQKERRTKYNAKMAPGKVFESMIPKGNKFRRMDEYYYAISQLYFQAKEVELYVGNPNNILSPQISLYPSFV